MLGTEDPIAVIHQRGTINIAFCVKLIAVAQCMKNCNYMAWMKDQK